MKKVSSKFGRVFISATRAAVSCPSVAESEADPLYLKGATLKAKFRLAAVGVVACLSAATPTLASAADAAEIQIIRCVAGVHIKWFKLDGSGFLMSRTSSQTPTSADWNRPGCGERRPQEYTDCSVDPLKIAYERWSHSGILIQGHFIDRVSGAYTFIDMNDRTQGKCEPDAERPLPQTRF